jgi:hypothetical protein
MATIGLDRLYYAPITEAPVTGIETYGTPVILAKEISAELSVELAEATLYADDGASEVVKEFKNGKLTLGVDGIGRSVAIGFRAKKSNGHYRYFWLYRVKFGVPSTNLATKGDSITFSTPTIEGTVLRRNKTATGVGSRT